MFVTIAYSPVPKIPVCAVSEAGGPGPLTSADLASYYGGPPDLRERDLGPPPPKLASIRDYPEYPDYPGSGAYPGHTMLAMEPDLKSKDPYDRCAASFDVDQRPL